MTPTNLQKKELRLWYGIANNNCSLIKEHTHKQGCGIVNNKRESCTYRKLIRVSETRARSKLNCLKEVYQSYFCNKTTTTIKTKKTCVQNKMHHTRAKFQNKIK